MSRLCFNGCFYHINFAQFIRLHIITEEQARDLVTKYIELEDPIVPVQEILDSGAVPRLKGYVVKPGKVSDSIFGGKGSYRDKNGKKVEFENPPLLARNGLPLRLMVRTPRISTHDINGGEIPFKDQILAMNHHYIHHYMLRLVKKVLGTSQFAVSSANGKIVNKWNFNGRD
ncbi:MAG: hypothetical protein AB1668_03475 [Nanoarchaeota archaeon]